MRRLVIAVGTTLTLAVLACSSKSTPPADTTMAAQGVTTPPADRAAEEAAIKQMDAQFFTNVNASNAAAAAEAYSDDAVYMEGNSPPIKGKEAIAKHLEQFTKLPQIKMNGEATSIDFSDDGSVAYEVGNFSAEFADPKGKMVKDAGKYLLVLRKFDGKWKVVAESNSSNGPAAQ